MRSLRRLARDEDGASAVEFAIAALPLFLFVFGALEYGRLMWSRIALQETALATARCIGLLHPSCAAGGTYSPSLATRFAQAQASAWQVSLPAASLTLTPSTTCQGSGNFAQVSIAYSFGTVAPQLLGALNGGLTLRAAACFPNQAS